MTKENKIKAIDESVRDIDRDILGIEKKLENLEEMTNPAESQKQYNELIDELQKRKVILTEAKKDIEDLYTLKKILTINPETENHGEEDQRPDKPQSKQPDKPQSKEKKE